MVEKQPSPARCDFDPLTEETTEDLRGEMVLKEAGVYSSEMSDGGTLKRVGFR